VVCRAFDIFGATDYVLVFETSVHEKTFDVTGFPQFFMILHGGGIAVTPHVFLETPVVSKRRYRKHVEIRICVDASHLAMRSIGTCILALTTCTHQTRRRTGLQTDTQVLDGTSVDADADSRHFLLFAPSNCFLIIIITVNTNCCQSDSSYLSLREEKNPLPF